MPAGQVQGPRGISAGSQEGPWLCIGQKSNVSQQEVRAEFTEDIERADIDRASRRLGKENMSLFFVWEPGGFY